jgi:hypothetical protein
MDDTAVQNKIDGIIFLLALAVSLLSGLVFGARDGNPVGVAVLSFAVVVVILLGVSYLQPSVAD